VKKIENEKKAILSLLPQEKIAISGYSEKGLRKASTTFRRWRRSWKLFLRTEKWLQWALGKGSGTRRVQRRGRTVYILGDW